MLAHNIASFPKIRCYPAFIFDPLFIVISIQGQSEGMNSAYQW